MTVVNPPTWLQSGVYNAEMDRLVTGLLTERATNMAGDLIGLDGGVVPPLDQLRVTDGSLMSVNVSGGVAIVPRTSLDPPGAYICYNQGNTRLVLDPASTAPRRDLIAARVYDKQQGDATSEWQLVVVKGQRESSNPTDPTLPPSSVPIARVLVVPSSQNGGVNKIIPSQIFDLRQFITGPGGVHLSWGNPNPRQSPGRLVYDVPNSALYVADGKQWDKLLTFDEWNTYFASYRPKSAYRSGQISTTSESWDTTIVDEDANPNKTMTAAVATDWLSTPSGQLRVTVQGYGHGSVGGLSAHMSYLVRRKDNGDTVGGDVNAFGRGPSFYTTAWATGSMTSIVFIPKEEPVRVLVYFRKDGAAGRAIFSRIRVIAEPIL